jgi:mono/diheme cytochrome c family protein
VARGAHLVAARGCVGCHGEDLAGHVELDNAFIGRLAGPNLTRGGRGGRLTDADWERAVRHGVRRDGSPLFVMPASEHTGMSDEDLGAIVAYARSLPARPNVPPLSRAGPVIGAMQAAGKVNLFSAAEIDHRRPHPARVAAEPTARYGAYLAAMCSGCHGPGLSGGKIPGAPPDWKPAANITPGGIGHYTEADFVRALREGVRPGGAPIDSQMPVRRITRHLDDTELRALYAYLHTLPSRPYGGR